MDARAAAESAARTAYGRLLAAVASRTRDVAAAEDALSEAFVAALRTWPRDGVPDNPAAWLLTAARRRLTDAGRQARRHADALAALIPPEHPAAPPDDPIPDDRLKLLFVCTHPAIDPAARTPLMLQAVLGLDAARVASAFLVAPAAMAQRLVRSKARIRDAGIPFAVPDPADWPDRVGAVLEAIYAAYGTGWEDVAGADPRRRGLAAEAVWLGRVVVDLLPDEPEAGGLLALMLHCEARRAARRTPAGEYVPLSEQDVTLWDRETAAEAERVLATAARAGRVGPFQLEAAIQSAHARRAVTGTVDWEAVALLYEGLVRIAPTAGALVGRAAAVGEARGPAAGLELLGALRPADVAAYQPYWAVRAHLLRRAGDPAAGEAFARAIGLTEDAAVRAFLLRRAAPASG